MRRAAHVDALQDHGEGGAIEGDLGPPRLHRRELNAALLQRARNDAPHGAAVEEQLHHDPAPLEEQIEVAFL
jgi:hypothetical protein